MILPIPAAASGGGRRPAVTTRPLANEDGVDLLKYPLEEEHRRIFENLAKEDTSYRELIRQLSAAGRPELSSQIGIRLMEAGPLAATTSMTIESSSKTGSVSTASGPSTRY